MTKPETYGEARFERTGRTDAIYTDAAVALPMTVEAYKTSGGGWGTAVYLSDAIRCHSDADALEARREAIERTIRAAIVGDGREADIE